MDEMLIQHDSCNTIYFPYIYKTYYNGLVSFARKIIENQLVAEDIAADVFMKYWIKKDDFVSEGKIKGFLFISAKNACLNYHKHRCRQATCKKDLLFLTTGYIDPVLETMINRETEIQANEVVESLPRECRKIIKLSFLQGHNNEKIATELSLSKRTVQNQKYRGIKLMQKRFASLQSG